jgi:hypothetical protein
MELADFAHVIPYKLDFILFDACFMGSVEVCYELKDKADYIVASPAEVIAPGFVYSTMMQHLFTSEADLIAVAHDFYEYYDSQNGLGRSATVSVVKTSALEQLATLVKSVTQQNLSFNELENLQTFGYGSQRIYFDLGDYLQKLSPKRLNEIQTSLDQCVLYKAHTPFYYSAGTESLQTIRAFSGLSIYIPQPEYPRANETHKELMWTKSSRNDIAGTGAGV